MDQCFKLKSAEEYPLPPAIDCTIDDLELVRRHNQQVPVDVQDFLHQSFPVLGVAASKWANASESIFMDLESPLGRLHRPTVAELSPPHTVDAVFADPDLKELYFRLFRGEYSLIWWHTFTDDSAIRTGFPQMRGCVVDKVDGMYAPGMHSFKLDPVDNGKTIQISRSSVELAGLRDNQLEALNCRIVHHFLQLVGADLGFRIRTLLVASLSAMYHSKKWWKEALDISIVSADMAVVAKDVLFLSRNLMMVARALKSCKKWFLAAEMYQQASEKCSDFRDRVDFLHGQVNALRHAGYFDEAEHGLFNIFRLSFAEFRGNFIHAPDFEVLVQEISNTYCLRASTGFVTTEPWPLVNKVCCLLLPLCEVACNSKRGGGSLINNPLHKKYWKANAAKRGLFAAFQSAAVQDSSQSSLGAFRTGVHSLSKNGFRFEEMNVDSSNFSIIVDLNKTWKSGDQKAIIERAERIAVIHCGRGECRSDSTVQRMERCAKCQDMYYCSRECQVAHWPEHRSRCKLVAKAIKSDATK